MLVRTISEYLSTAAAKGKWTMVNDTNELELLVKVIGPQFFKMLNLILLAFLLLLPKSIPIMPLLPNL